MSLSRQLLAALFLVAAIVGCVHRDPGNAADKPVTIVLPSYTDWSVPPVTASGVHRYLRDVRMWQAVPVPQPDTDDYHVWSYAGNRCPLLWRVSLSPAGIVVADVVPWADHPVRDDMGFQAATPKFKEPYTTARVSDGWLVAFNEGEFGGELDWFSRDGSQSYKVSGHQVNVFARWQKQIYAIHYAGWRGGSLIRVYRTSARERWHTETIAEFADTPYAFQVLPDGSFIVASHGRILRVAKGRTPEQIVASELWGGLCLTSVVESADGKTVYMGLAQYVVECDIASGHLRFLIPDQTFLYRPTKDTEAYIRANYYQPR